jgi:hypothetical protein
VIVVVVVVVVVCARGYGRRLVVDVVVTFTPMSGDVVGDLLVGWEAG